MSVSSKRFLDIQATKKCRFTLKRVRGMIITYRLSVILFARRRCRATETSVFSSWLAISRKDKFVSHPEISSNVPIEIAVSIILGFSKVVPAYFYCFVVFVYWIAYDIMAGNSSLSFIYFFAKICLKPHYRAVWVFSSQMVLLFAWNLPVHLCIQIENGNFMRNGYLGFANSFIPSFNSNRVKNNADFSEFFVAFQKMPQLS